MNKEELKLIREHYQYKLGNGVEHDIGALEEKLFTFHIEKLLGDIDWHGESNADSQVCDNYRLLIRTLPYILSELCGNVKSDRPGNASADAIAKLKKTLRDYILGELGVEIDSNNNLSWDDGYE